MLGQHPIPPDAGLKLVELLGLDESVVPVLAAVPMRGGLPTAVPTDPYDWTTADTAGVKP